MGARGGGEGAARCRGARADRPAAGTRSAQAGRAGGGQRSHPHGGLAQPRRGSGRRGCATDRRAEHRVRVPADRRRTSSTGTIRSGTTPHGLGSERRGAAELEERSRKPRASRAWCCGTAGSTAPARRTGRAGSSSARFAAAVFHVGRGSGVFSFIHVDDAADATVAAVDGARPASTTSSTTSRLSARGCLSMPTRSRASTVAGAALPGADPQASTGSCWRPSCAVHRTSARRRNWAGRHATPAGGRGSVRQSARPGATRRGRPRRPLRGIPKSLGQGTQEPGTRNGVVDPVEWSPLGQPS